jgi:hypothetical protein
VKNAHRKLKCALLREELRELVTHGRLKGRNSMITVQILYQIELQRPMIIFSSAKSDWISTRARQRSAPLPILSAARS